MYGWGVNSSENMERAMQSRFDRKVNQLREMESGFCNPVKNKVAEELREDLREDLERRGFNKQDIAEMESGW